MGSTFETHVKNIAVPAASGRQSDTFGQASPQMITASGPHAKRAP